MKMTDRLNAVNAEAERLAVNIPAPALLGAASGAAPSAPSEPAPSPAPAPEPEPEPVRQPEPAPAPEAVSAAQDSSAAQYQALLATLQRQQQTIAALQQQIAERQAPAQPADDGPIIAFNGAVELSSDEREALGVENVQTIQRMVQQIVTQMLEPHIKQLRSAVKEGTQLTQAQAARQHDANVIAAVPNAPQLFNDPNFIAWLQQGKVEFTGQSRAEAFQAAHTNLNTTSVIEMLRAYNTLMNAAKDRQQQQVREAEASKQTTQQQLREQVEPNTTSAPPKTEPGTGEIFDYNKFVQAGQDLLKGRIPLEAYRALEQQAAAALSNGRVRFN